MRLMAKGLRGRVRWAGGVVRSAGPRVAAALAAVGLAALAVDCGLTGVSAGVPSLGHGMAPPLWSPAGSAVWAAILPWLAALLEIVAAGLALTTRPAPPPERAVAADVATDGGPAAEMRAELRALRAMIQAECRELATVRLAFGDAAHEAGLVGARLSGVALDAEARLVASVTGAEDALRHPEGVLARASAASLWLERALPELAFLIEAGHRARELAGAAAEEAGGHAAGAVDAAPAALDIPAELTRRLADQILSQVGTQIGGEIGDQIAALETTADRLRRDTAGLVSAGRGFAAAGAGVLARIDKAAGQANAALEALSPAAATVGAAAEQAAASLAEASARVVQATQGRLPDGLVDGLSARMADLLGERLDGAGELLAQQAGALRHELAAAAAAASQDVGAAAARSDAWLAEAGTQLEAALSEASREVSHWATQREAGTAESQAIRTELRAAMQEVAQDMAEAGAAAAARLDDVAARADAAVIGLGTLPAQTDRLENAAMRLHDEGELLAQAGRVLAATGADVTTRMDVSEAGIAALLRVLEGAALSGVAMADTVAGRLAGTFQGILAEKVAAACAPPLQMLAEASAVLCADSAGLDAAGRDAMAALQREAEFLLAAGQAVATDGAGVVARLSATAAVIATLGEGAQARAEAAAASLAELPRMAAELAGTTTALRLVATDLDTARLDTVRQDATRFQDAGDKLTTAVSAAASMLGVVSGVTADLSHVATRLQDDAASSGRAASELRDSGTEVALRLGSLVTASAPSSEAAAMPVALAMQLDRLEALVARLHDAAVARPAERPVSGELIQPGAGHAQIAEALDGALARHDASTRAVIQAMARVEAAAEAVRVAAPDAAPGTSPGPADRPVPDHGGPTLATLQRLGGVERDTAVLLTQAEALVEAVLGGHAAPLPPDLAGRMPDLLAGVETTIGRLRSVATALALACDGPLALVVGMPSAAPGQTAPMSTGIHLRDEAAA